MSAKLLNLLLIIEDNPQDCTLIQRVINQFDLSITVVIHHSAESALEYLTDVLNNPQLILLDLTLQPGAMDGIDFMRAMRKIKRIAEIPIAIVTGGAMDVARAHSENASDYILKPFTASQFSKLVSRLGFEN